jgi:hypothetical protein
MTSVTFRIGTASRTAVVASAENAELVGKCVLSFDGRDDLGRLKFSVIPRVDGFRWSRHTDEFRMFSTENSHIYPKNRKFPQFRLSEPEECVEVDGVFHLVMPLEMKAPIPRGPYKHATSGPRAPIEKPRKPPMRVNSIEADVQVAAIPIQVESLPKPEEAVPSPDTTPQEPQQFADKSYATLSIARRYVNEMLEADESLTVSVLPNGRGIRITRDV